MYTEVDEKGLEISQDRKQNVVGNIIKLNGKRNSNPKNIDLDETKVGESDKELGNEGSVNMVGSTLGKDGHLADKSKDNEIIFEEPENNTSNMTNGLTNGLT